MQVGLKAVTTTMPSCVLEARGANAQAFVFGVSLFLASLVQCLASKPRLAGGSASRRLLRMRRCIRPSGNQPGETTRPREATRISQSFHCIFRSHMRAPLSCDLMICAKFPCSGRPALLFLPCFRDLQRRFAWDKLQALVNGNASQEEVAEAAKKLVLL